MKKETGLQKVIKIINESKNVDEAFMNTRNERGISVADACDFCDKYNPTGTRTMKQSFELFYNDIKLSI